MTNIFFAITAVSSVITTTLLIVALYFLIKILKKGKNVVDTVSRETELIIEDVEEVRSSVKRHAKTVKEFATVAFIKKTIDMFLKNESRKK